MGVKFGEIDAEQILDNEYRIGVLEAFVEWILSNNSAFVGSLTSEAVGQMRDQVVRRLQQKYPKSGIALREE